MTKTTFNIFRGTKTKDIIPDTTTRDLRPKDVFIEMTHAGLCGTDRIFRPNGIALGHEGAGTVRQVGDQVTSVKPGDRVGLSWVQKVCSSCEQCLTSE
jgi:D-arabinose 1-dehydrogenase-like Zn-dependent alcohol dehydrogenase